MIVSDPTNPDYNCHLSYDEATVFIGNMLHASNWKAASATEHKRALITATLLLDRYVDWTGYVTDNDQTPPWPRKEVQQRDREYGTYFDDTAVPDIIKLATTEYAEALLGEDLTEDQETGIASLRVDTIALTFNKLDRKDVMPDHVKLICNQYGTVNTGKSGTVKVVRR